MEKVLLNNPLNQKNFRDIYRTFHPKTTDYTFFSRAHGIFSRTDQTLGHKTRLNQFEKTEIIPCIFSDHKSMKIKINHKEKNVKNTNTWTLKKHDTI